ncbi:hypothetical protein [Acinetobacter sp. YH12039]|uniref:hypothetical protein n=1 Tax=Acinetobacter sp. YH12039 TaxID=2601047 RepID=UPI0015D0F4DD|nr:hypothetical protein [Acinetobacter sp. YH12039]
MNFDKYKRQIFLTEEYYLKTKKYNEEGIPLYLESDAFEDDQYNCGEASRWQSIKSPLKSKHVFFSELV